MLSRQLGAPKKGTLDVAEALRAAAHDYDPIRTDPMPETSAAWRAVPVRSKDHAGMGARDVWRGVQGGAGGGGAGARGRRRRRRAGRTMLGGGQR